MDEQLFSVGYCIDIIKGICDFPQEVRYEVIRDDRGFLILVNVAKLDMGKVIGIKGENIQAIRKLVAAAGKKEHEQVAVKLNEPEESR